MRCCQSQNREHKCDGAGGYGKDHNAVVSKKHGVHNGPSNTCPISPGFPMPLLVRVMSLHIRAIREPLMCSSRQTRNRKNLWSGWNKANGFAFAQPADSGRKGRMALSAYSAQPLSLKSSIQQTSE